MSTNFPDNDHDEAPAIFMRPVVLAAVALPLFNLLGALLLADSSASLLGFSYLVASCVAIAGLAYGLPESPSSRGLALLSCLMNFGLAYASGIGILYGSEHHFSVTSVAIGSGLGLWSLFISIGGLAVFGGFGEPRGINARADANVDSLLAAAAVGGTILVLTIAAQSVVEASQTALVFLIVSIITLLIAVTLRQEDGFWQLVLGFVGGVFGILQVVFVFLQQRPDLLIEQVTLVAAVCQMYWSYRLVMEAIETVRRRDNEAREDSSATAPGMGA